MRVVISDLPPEYGEKPKVKGEGFDVTDEEGNRIDTQGDIKGPGGGDFDRNKAVTADIDLSLKRVGELLIESRETGKAPLPADEVGVKLLKENSARTGFEGIELWRKRQGLGRKRSGSPVRVRVGTPYQ